MKNVKILTGILLALTCQSALAERFCGSPANGAFLYDTKEWGWPQKTMAYYCDGWGNFGDFLRDGVYQLCVDYESSTVSAKDVTWFYNCVIDDNSFACLYDSYLSGVADCTKCPTGSAAGNDKYAAHRNTTCTFCTIGYYKSGDTCVACPGGGTTTEPGNEITRCYLAPGDASDDTGTFTITDKCYYSN